MPSASLAFYPHLHLMILSPLLILTAYMTSGWISVDAENMVPWLNNCFVFDSTLQQSKIPTPPQRFVLFITFNCLVLSPNVQSMNFIKPLSVNLTTPHVEKSRFVINYFKSIAILTDKIWRIATRLFSKWFDNGVTSKCLNGLAMGICITSQRKSDTHALCFVLPAHNLTSTFRWAGSNQRKTGEVCCISSPWTEYSSQFTVGYIRSFLLLMGTLEWVERVCHQRNEIPAWLRGVDILLMMTN